MVTMMMVTVKRSASERQAVTGFMCVAWQNSGCHAFYDDQNILGVQVVGKLALVFVEQVQLREDQQLCSLLESPKNSLWVVLFLSVIR